MLLTIIIDLDPNIARIGPFLITWHGVFSVLGILAAARLGFWLLEKDVPNMRGTGDGLAWMVVVGLIGARLLYVWENFRIFSGNLLRMFALTEGGISQWGGLFGAMVGAYIWARRSKFSFWKIIDAGGAGAMIGLTVGRIATSSTGSITARRPTSRGVSSTSTRTRSASRARSFIRKLPTRWCCAFSSSARSSPFTSV